MQSSNQNLLIITDGNLIFYYANFYVDDGFIVINGNEKTLYCDNRYYFSATLNATCKVELLNPTVQDEFFKTLNGKNVGLVYDFSTTSFSEKLKSYGAILFDATSQVLKSTSVKTAKELSLIQTACDIAEKSFLETIPLLKEGVTENEIKAELEYRFKKNGGDIPSFDTIIAFSEGSAIPHYKTGNVKLKKDMPILMDFGCFAGGYASDMTRTLFFGNPSTEFIKAYNAVKGAHENAFNKITAGISGKEADAFARDYLKGLGLSEYFTHSLGHGVGVKVHEAPRLAPSSSQILENGNVFSIEPGLYFNKKFGIRIEDTVYLENGKCKTFFKTTKELLVL